MADKSRRQLHAPSNTNSIPSERSIRQELAKIIDSPQFAGSPHLCSFLRFIVEKTLRGEAADVKAYTVATQVLGRKTDFDPNLDPIVRIQAGRLRRSLEQYYRDQDKGDGVVITVPKGAYVPVFHSVLRQEREGPLISEARSEQTLAVLSGPSVAVMPLLNLTGDPKQDYFSEGLAEELTSELARYQEVRVIAYQSTRRWIGEKIDPRAAGQDLGVRFLVEGNIRKDARTLKIDLHVVDTQSGQRVWGQQYCRDLKADSIIALQEEIAQKVSAKISSEYGLIPRTLSRESRRKPPEALETYEAFLRFYHHATILSPETFAESLRALEQAVSREPESGLAWSLLAFLYSQNYSLQFSPIRSTLEQALVSAQKGVLLEPENQIARAALAEMYFFRSERDSFLSEAEVALSLNPNAPFYPGFLGWLLALYGEWERGLAILAKGIALNPHYPGWFHVAPYLYYFLQERFTEAYQEALALHLPQLFWDPLLRAAALGRLEREEEGAQALTELLQLRPDFPTVGRFLISCFVKFDNLIDAIIAGLRQAGLMI
jgi:adenylate cyclase